jgi:hypothetical protein
LQDSLSSGSFRILSHWAHACTRFLETCSDRPVQDIRQQNRRRNRRLKIGQPLKLRPTDPHLDPFEDISVTKNVSRDGFYFLTHLLSYKEGMRVFVTLPYHSPNKPGDHEYVGQVIRIEPLAEGQTGVAIQLLSALSPAAEGTLRT